MYRRPTFLKPYEHPQQFFRLKMHAIELCIQESLNKGLMGANVCICINSQIDLKALATHRFV